MPFCWRCVFARRSWRHGADSRSVSTVSRLKDLPEGIVASVQQATDTYHPLCRLEKCRISLKEYVHRACK